MVFRKHNSTAGFSLIEVLVAITILGLVVVPIGSSLVLSFRLNARSEQMLQAQLAVSSAVETIMAEGYDPALRADYEANFGVLIPDGEVSKPGAAYRATVYAIGQDGNKDEHIFVTTYFRPAEGGDDT